MLRVAVKLPAATGRIGDYLADVIALGVDIYGPSIPGRAR